MLREELADKAALLGKGLTQRSQVNELQRAEADSLARSAQSQPTSASAAPPSPNLREQRAGMEAKRREAASAEINELRSKIGDLREQLRSRDDMLARPKSARRSTASS